MKIEKIISFFRILLIITLTTSWIFSDFFQRTPIVFATTETYTTSGTWQAPAGVTSVIVEVWGAGGGGGGGGGNRQGGGGGAGGQYAKKTFSVTPLTNYSYTIGSGGTGGASTNGTAGGDTTFNSTTVVAKGGAGGISYSNGGTGGQGSTSGGIGDVVYAGGNGADREGVSSGGGGGGAGSTGTGNNASGTTGGSAKSEYGGAGGDGTSLNNSPGYAGSSYGGGGGGSTKNATGGNGANGFIRITYNIPPSFSGNVSDNPDPVAQGNNVTFSGTATDGDGDTWYLAVCKTNTVTPGTGGGAPSCETDQTYCISSSAVASNSQNSCAWTSSGTGEQIWYAFACDTDTSIGARCSSVNNANSPVTVNTGSLTVDIVDDNGDSVSSPSISMGAITFSFSYQSANGTFGISTEKIRVDNTTQSPQWTLSIAADSGSTAFWDGTINDYDFNDPTANAGDGADDDSLGGQMTINASAGTLTPQGGCSNTGITLGSSASFSEGVTDSITLLSAGSSADTNCYWDFTGIGISQTVPAEQNADNYSIDMTLTIVAS